MANRTFERQINREMPIRSATVVEFCYGAGGRVCDLPPQYQDAIAEANRQAHPRTLDRRVAELMTRDRYRSSEHPHIRGMTLGELRAYQAELDRRYCSTFRAKYSRRGTWYRKPKV